MSIDLSLHLIALLALAAFLAGFIDSIAGGGGLITVPAMLLAGIPPLQMLATNKLGSLFGSGSATLAYSRAGHVDVARQLPMALMCGGGSVFGAAAASFVSGRVLAAVLPLLPGEQAAVIAFAERAGTLTPQRQQELAALAVSATGAQGDTGVVRLFGIANWLLGRRA